MKVLFVCTGNICRSPTAEAILREKAQGRIVVDSAGTHAYHVGDPPDARTQAEARRHGIMMGDLRARTVTKEDFRQFDWLIGMAREHVQFLEWFAMQHFSGAEQQTMRAKIRLFLDFVPGYQGKDVPDPYYEGQKVFADVFDLIEQGCDCIVQALVKNQ